MRPARERHWTDDHPPQLGLLLLALLGETAIADALKDQVMALNEEKRQVIFAR